MPGNAMRPLSFDHVALWVAHRDSLATFLCDFMGVHEIERTDSFTLVGADARLGKLTLFDAEGPRERGALQHIALRVKDLGSAVAQLPGRVALERSTNGLVTFDVPDQLRMGLVEGDGTVDYDLDHVLLGARDPAASATALVDLGLELDNDDLRVADKHVRLERAEVRLGERPLLNHLAFLVDSASAVEQDARERGFEIERVVDAANTLAVFLSGPDQVTIEYVEHKPGFALR
jgi:catechol 2,3-dioxygenase-like lactoylglutathione lyase family enzyme